MLFTAMIKWLHVANVGLWPHVVYYAVDMLNNAPNSSGFTPKEIFSGIQGDRSFRHFHVFGSPAYVLDPRLQEGNTLPT